MNTLLLSLVAMAGAADTLDAIPDASELLGTWQVDLRPTPDAPAYFQQLVFRGIDGKTFTGTFYGTEITNGQLNLDKGAVWFAFTTADGSGTYNTSGKLVGDHLEGCTHSLGRQFLLPWTAERTE